VSFDGGPTHKESRTIAPGETKAVIARLPDVALGLAICYDLRFPELFRRLALDGAEALTMPAAFTLHTGKDHWEPLVRARAIENTCYVAAAAQWGTHHPGRSTWGKSMIVDPWGQILAAVPEGEGIAVAELDPDQLAKVRKGLPTLAHVRL
jgi:predicted amidohydrolase